MELLCLPIYISFFSITISYSNKEFKIIEIVKIFYIILLGKHVLIVMERLPKERLHQLLIEGRKDAWIK